MTMELTKKQRTIKYVLYCAMLLVANLLQNTGGLFPSVFSAHCLLLIPLAVCIYLLFFYNPQHFIRRRKADEGMSNG